ncbi:MAG: CotH kinase family protein [Patescibacteria group bacterium]
MEDNLPINSNLSYNFLSDDNKNYVNGYFTSSQTDYQSKVKLRYRGLISSNWQSEKKSLRIKFPKNNLFQGMRALNLMIPEDRENFLEPLNIYRAKKLGLFVPDFKFVRVYINNRYFGVYLAAEAWSKELLAKNDTIDTNNIFSNKDEIDKIKDENPAFFNWKSYIADNEEGPFEELEALSELTNKASDQNFSRLVGNLVDLEKVYKWHLINVLAGSAHQSYMTNFVLIFRQETGKFEPIPWNVEFEPIKNKIYDDNLPLLVRRIFKNKEYSDKFLTLLNSYVGDNKNLEDDLAYYNTLFKKTRYDFYKDNAKNQNNFGFIQAVKEGRELIINNFNGAKKLLANDEAKKITIWERQNYLKTLNFAGSFQYVNDASISIDKFLEQNQQFKKVGINTINLGPGTFVFSRTIIIPKNLRLAIEPGTTLYFYPNISLISYSPVTAVGNSAAPIVFTPAFKNQPWGSFGVINTGSEKNIFEFIKVSGGSSDTINSVPFLSQFSLHNADSIVENSVFEEGKSDDGAHIILGSVTIKNSLFRNNSSDSIDLDFVKYGRIASNRFLNTKMEESNGDGIDLSGTDDLEITGNTIINHGDKCISVGEAAKTVISGNLMVNCDIGIAIKDASVVKMENNIIVKNKTAGLALYRKKQEFIKGGNAVVSKSIIWDNGKEIDSDKLSFLSIDDSTIKGGYERGININQNIPDFNLILPAYIKALVGM